MHCRPITTFLPLAIVLGVSIFKEAMEDMRRYQADCEVNARACLVLDPAAGAWQTRRWRDVKARPACSCLTCPVRLPRRWVTASHSLSCREASHVCM